MSILKQEAIDIIESMREDVITQVVDYLRNISPMKIANPLKG